jgi:hypothetical protein
MARSSLALLVLLAAGSAQAQSSVTIVPASIDRTTCNTNDNVTITVNARSGTSPLVTFTNTPDWRIWVSSSSSCSESAPTDAQLLTDDATIDTTNAAAGTYLLLIAVQKVVGAITGLDSATCGGTAGVSDQGTVCARYQNTSLGSATVSVDTVPLKAPSITGIDVGDSKVLLRVSPPSGQTVTGWYAYSRPAFCTGTGTSGLGGSGGGGSGGSGGSGGTGGSGGSGGSGGTGAEICGNEKDDDGDGQVDCADPDCAGQLRELGGAEPSGFKRSSTLYSDVSTLTVDGLQNGTTYQLYAVARRDSDVSPASNVVTGAPRAVVGFWESYHDAGGDQTGCGAAGGAAPLAGGLVLLALARARRAGRSR